MTNKTTEALKLAEEALGNSQQHLDLHNPEWVNVRRQNDEAIAAIREALEEAAKWCEAKQSYSAMHANTEFAAGIRGLK